MTTTRAQARVIVFAFVFLVLIIMLIVAWLIDSIRVNLIIPALDTTMGEAEIPDFFRDYMLRSAILPLAFGLLVSLIVVYLAVTMLREEEDTHVARG